MHTRSQNKVGVVLTTLLSLILIASSLAKLFGAAPIVEAFQKWGLQDHRILIGVGELATGLLFLIPKTHSIGALLATAYFGGAIVTHMQNGESYVAQSFILLAVWVASILRNPDLLKSLKS